jgi:hypothetical protein
MNSTLICIPVRGELLPAIGGTGFVAFFGGILLLSMGSFLMARWACLEYRWKWKVKIKVSSKSEKFYLEVRLYFQIFRKLGFA